MEELSDAYSDINFEFGPNLSNYHSFIESTKSHLNTTVIGTKILKKG